MNAERHKYWSAYIADVQGRMLLVDWDVHLSDVYCELTPGAFACVIFEVDEQRFVELFLCKDFDDRDADEQRMTIVHELVHVGLRSLFQTCERYYWPRPSAPARYADILKEAHEETVERITAIVAPSLPLPPKVKA